MKASELHEEYGEYPEAVQVLIDAKLHLDAAAKAKRFEDCGPHTSFELSSDNIARKYILRYRQPPEKGNQTIEKRFYGLLKYTKDSEYQITLLKHNKRFSEAFEKHRCSQNYVAYYHLAFAQGPNTCSVVKKSTSSNAFSDTYYDSALQLTAMQGVDAVYFCVQKPYIIIFQTYSVGEHFRDL